MEAFDDKGYFKRLKEFPCTFTLVDAGNVTPNRLKKMEHNLLVDTEDDDEKAVEIINQNLLTFVYFSLGKITDAAELSNAVVDSTQWKNITCVGNRAYVMLKTGDEQEARKCLKVLEKMKDDYNYLKLMAESKAEMAYCYSRLGGSSNLNLAINMYSETVREVPDNYLWKFGLGLAYRRASKPYMAVSNPEIFDEQDCNQKAITYLFDVADNGDIYLQARAYSELANLRKQNWHRWFPENDMLFRNLDILELCEKALEKGSKMSHVLTNCGIALMFIDVDRSIMLLEKSISIKRKSMAYHYLGKCYLRKVQLHAKRARPRKPQGQNKRRTMNDLLNKDDRFIKIAVKSFERAIEISEENVSAIMDLGILLRRTDQIKEALIQFNKLISSRLIITRERFSVITAYEQAGLCYLQMSETPGNDYQSCQDLGRKKLTIAFNLAADLTKTMPGFQNIAQKVWDALRMLENTTGQRVSNSNLAIDRLKLIQLANAYGDIIEVVQKLIECREENPNYSDIIINAVQGYLLMDQPENALTFINLVSINPIVSKSNWWTIGSANDLKIQVLLQAISGRLRDTTENATVLFQQLFLLCFGTCFGLHVEESDEQACQPGFVGDLLVVFQGDPESPVVKTARRLKEVATHLFGLEAAENLKGTDQHGKCRADTRLEQIKKYQIVLIVLGDETRKEFFDEMSEWILNNITLTQHVKQRILVVDAGLRGGQVPPCLTQHECFKLKGTGGLGDIDHGPVIDRPQQGFHGDVDAVLKLFCFIIGQQWSYQ